MNQLKYTYQSSYREEYSKCISEIPSFEKNVSVESCEKGIILPAVAANGRVWGIGGVVTPKKELVEFSKVKGAFGEVYDYDEREIDYIDESVFFCGILPLHWGHFIIDYICRLWAPLKETKYRIAYFSRPFDKELCGNFRECLELMGIPFDRLIYIDKPTQFKKVLVVEPSMGFAFSFNTHTYRFVINNIIENALKKAEYMGLKPIEKIYFTRTRFGKWDIGEWEIEKAFLNNGYTILSPESLGLVEQVFYIYHAKEIVSLSGTIPHNYIFAQSSSKILILNRHSQPHWPQYRINYIFDLDVVWIDVYHKWHHFHKIDYGSPKIWVEFSNCLVDYFKDNNMKLPPFYRLFWSKVRNYIMFFCYWKLGFATYWVKQYGRLYRLFKRIGLYRSR